MITGYAQRNRVAVGKGFGLGLTSVATMTGFPQPPKLAISDQGIPMDSSPQTVLLLDAISNGAIQ